MIDTFLGSFMEEIQNFKLVDQNGREVKQLPMARARKEEAPFPFIMVVQKALAYLCRLGLTGDQWDVLAWALSALNMDDEIFWDEPLCFAETGIRRENQIRARKALVTHGVLREHRKYGNKWIYKPNELLCWRGTIQEWKKSLQENMHEISDLHAANGVVYLPSRGID
jgi:hypothetical protein